MAKRDAGRRPSRKSRPIKRAKARPTRRATLRKRATAAKGRKSTARKNVARAKKASVKKAPSSRVRTTVSASKAPKRAARLDRSRRTLEDVVPSPPSSLDMIRRGSAVRTGRAEVQDNLHEHPGMTPAITGGDVDANWENAYFSGDEAPGGDNPTPDQEVVDDIGRALGVEYQDNEELKASDKVGARDKHRWELDPASSEYYKDRKKRS
jgi:hypothetical protein